MQNKLLVATNNPGKLSEFRELLSPLVEVQVLAPMDLGLHFGPEEGAADYRGNAEIKAREFHRLAGLPCLADDSGLEVDALGGAPGLYSARLGGPVGKPDAERRRLLLDMLQGLPRPWKARFVCSLVFMPDGQTLLAWEGECRGEVVPIERGDGGFGYDPIFLVEGTGKTMAELPAAVKNRLSHRARAVQAGLESIATFFRRVSG